MEEMEDQHLLEDHLKEIEEMRRRKTQSLDPLILQIFHAWVRWKLQSKEETTEEDDEVPF